MEKMEQDTINILPSKSKPIYEKEYNFFNSWCQKNYIQTVSENVLLSYYVEMSKTKKSSTLWASYSMLRACLNVYKKLDISKYATLQGFLKRQSEGYQPKKSKTFDREEVDRFIREAHDLNHLAMKVILIMGYAGACRRDELLHMSINDLEFKEEIIIVTVPKTTTHSPRLFVVNEEQWIALIKHYVELRPKNATTKRFFMTYRNGRCTTSPIGINKMGRIPRIIATFLKLSNPEQYTGHCFRRSSASHSANRGGELITIKHHGRWKSSAVAEGHIETALKKKIEEALMQNSSNPSQPSTSFTDVEVRHPDDVSVNLQGNRGPSTSIISSSENETNDRPYSVSEDPLAEDMYQDEDDEDSEAEDKNFEMLDVTDSQVLQGEVEPLRVEVNNDNISSKECDLFGEYIAKHLQRLPVEMALKLQSGIQALVMQTRLEYIREHPSEAPAMVKEERSAEDSTRTSDAADNATQNGTEKRSQNTDQQQQPAAKRFKPNSSGQETTKSKSSTTHAPQNQNRRTEYTVFAEHIALQLEQLPEDVSIQLQTEIYDLITQTYSKHTDEDVPNRVKIKDEIHYVDPSELIDL